MSNLTLPDMTCLTCRPDLLAGGFYLMKLFTCVLGLIRPTLARQRNEMRNRISPPFRSTNETGDPNSWKGSPTTSWIPLYDDVLLTSCAMPFD